MSKPIKKMVVEILYPDLANLRRAMDEVTAYSGLIGEMSIRSNGIEIRGNVSYFIPEVEPREEIINNQRCFVYRSNM